MKDQYWERPFGDNENSQDQLNSLLSFRNSEGVIFFHKNNALQNALCIAELQEDMIDSKTIMIGEYIAIKGKHPWFVREYFYYDAHFQRDPTTGISSFHSFQPTNKPSNINERDLDFKFGY